MKSCCPGIEVCLNNDPEPFPKSTAIMHNATLFNNLQTPHFFDFKITILIKTYSFLSTSHQIKTQMIKKLIFYKKRTFSDNSIILGIRNPPISQQMFSLTKLKKFCKTTSNVELQNATSS